eukprot:360008-Chlamydomonas_euryale.AAC.4
MTRTSSTKPSDKSKLLTEIKSAVGLKIMTREVSDALIVVARAHLRWACGMRGVGRYCLMLGICGEFARLQTMLYSIPELTDDEEQFKEIMQVFLAYAGGLEEELDLDAFVKVRAVLACAGQGLDMDLDRIGAWPGQDRIGAGEGRQRGAGDCSGQS